MPTEAVPSKASCSRSRRATASAWRRLSVMSSTIQTVPWCVLVASIAFAIMRPKESGTILALQLPFEVELAPAVDDRSGDLAEREVALAVRIDDVAGLADQLLEPVAEHLGELGIAEEEAPLARERDAERKIAEQRLVLELGVPRAARIADRLDERRCGLRVVHRGASASKSSA